MSVSLHRGDGEQGEDVTENVRRFIPDLPLKITNSSALSIVSPNFEVRGEVIIKKDDFRSANEALASSAKSGAARIQQYANPRNLASGILSRKHVGKHAAVPVKLTFVAYALLAPQPVGTLKFETQKVPQKFEFYIC